VKNSSKDIFALLANYLLATGKYDEMVTSNGEIKNHWLPIWSNIEKLGLKNISRKHKELQEILKRNGVTYSSFLDGKEINRAWRLDPIPFVLDYDEWEKITAGLKQRAFLLSYLHNDLYSKKNCIKDGILPADLIACHSGFLTALDNCIQKEKSLIPFLAFDIARGPDGKMWIINDRCQAPSGLGYALENRFCLLNAFSELKEDTNLEKITPFYAKINNIIAELAEIKNPSIALLTPGPTSETYFEHAYLSAYLGFYLVRGDDMIIKDESVWLKSIDGLKKVDVILRRVDENFCDPLELRYDSQLDVPGLVECIRKNNVFMINPLGSGIIENNALFAFLPSLCKYYFNEELILPNAATWWCDQKNELSYVLSNIENLLIKKIDRALNFKTVYGKKLTKHEIELSRDQIIEKPYLYIGQEEVSFSTTPSWIENKIEPRFASIRCYCFAEKNDYIFLPGGLTRTASERDSFFVSNRYGGIAKDTWIVKKNVNKSITFTIQTRNQINQNTFDDEILTSRSAENIFWVGRYGERALQASRFCSLALNAYIEDRKYHKDYRKKKRIKHTFYRTDALNSFLPWFFKQKYIIREKNI
jgi:uncharacterized circularly permuted ATP-grasp superfamily protein